MKLNLVKNRALFQVRDGPITYYFTNKRIAKKRRNTFGKEKKVELGPDHWRFKK